MTTRRVFLGGALAAASAATLPRTARAEAAGRTGTIKTKDDTEFSSRIPAVPGRQLS